MNPGDTLRNELKLDTGQIPAQRRPGREPRRHPTRSARRSNCPSSLNEGRGVNPGDTWEDDVDVTFTERSTKAGA